MLVSRCGSRATMAESPRGRRRNPSRDSLIRARGATAASIRTPPSRTCKLTLGVRSLNCADPGAASESVPGGHEGARSVPFLMQVPGLPMRTGIEG
eukprot:4087385-Alexandrium_andersonii.AAC.1